MLPAQVSLSIEFAVGVLQQSAPRLIAVTGALEIIDFRANAFRRELEERAPVPGAAGVQRAIEVAVDGLYQPAERKRALRAVKRVKKSEGAAGRDFESGAKPGSSALSKSV